MKLNELLLDAPLTITFSGGKLNITYNPRFIRFRREDLSMQTQDDLAKLLCSVVTTWDLLRDDGTVWPLEPDLMYDHALANGETQEGLPRRVFEVILDRIGADVQAPLAQTTSTPLSTS